MSKMVTGFGRGKEREIAKVDRERSIKKEGKRPFTIMHAHPLPTPCWSRPPRLCIQGTRSRPDVRRSPYSPSSRSAAVPPHPLPGPTQRPSLHSPDTQGGTDVRTPSRPPLSQPARTAAAKRTFAHSLSPRWQGTALRQTARRRTTRRRISTPHLALSAPSAGAASAPELVAAPTCALMVVHGIGGHSGQAVRDSCLCWRYRADEVWGKLGGRRGGWYLTTATRVLQAPFPWSGRE